MLPLGRFLAPTNRATVRVGGVLTRASAMFQSWGIASGLVFFFRKVSTLRTLIAYPGQDQVAPRFKH